MRELEGRLEAHAGEIARLVARATGVLRYEGREDLCQGIVLRALERGASYRDTGEASFVAWLRAVGRSYLADRVRYWQAIRRKPAGLLRLTAHGSRGVEPAAGGPGPSTVASRKEHLRLAVQALATLLPRDRDLVQWSSEDLPLEEQARRLGLGYDAAKQARMRAIERFRKAFRLATSRGPKR